MSKLESELDMIKDMTLQEIKMIRGNTEDPVQLQELPGYSFTIQNRKTWTYTDFVKNMETEFKKLKKDEEADGTATFTEKESLIFSSPKGQ